MNDILFRTCQTVTIHSACQRNELRVLSVALKKKLYRNMWFTKTLYPNHIHD